MHLPTTIMKLRYYLSINATKPVKLKKSPITKYKKMLAKCGINLCDLFTIAFSAMNEVW